MSTTMEEAVSLLRAQGQPCTPGVLRAMCTGPYAERFEKRRLELAPAVEAKLANDLLDNARRAQLGMKLAVKRTYEKLKRGEIDDPARAARDLSQVATQSIDKRLAILGRPTVITEHRDVAEIIRALEGLKVAQIIDGTAEELPAT
jgi:hypothetical protein